MKKIFTLFIVFSISMFAQIKFDGAFESGNIAQVNQIDSTYFQVSTRQDIGGRWFYFRIAGVKNKKIKVEVTTSDVKRAVYSYDNVNFMRFTQLESPSTNVFQKTFAHDTVYVAYYNPYTFSYLQQRIHQWEQSKYVSVDTLGFTNHNLPIEEITLTDKSVPDSLKYNVWIHARTHPGETPSSFHFDGIVQRLLSSDDVIAFYRKKIVYHLIPFTNPDGVYYGRSRTNYDGVDVESNWGTTPDNTTEEVKILKKRMTEVNNQKTLSVFLNLHSQASSNCTFWIHTAASTSDNYYRRENQFANLSTSDNPYFAQSDYSFSSLKGYFPEGWLWNNWGSGVIALTYETPYDHYSNNDWVSNENLYEIGSRTVYAISEYLDLSYPKWILLDDKNASVTGNWQIDSSGVQFYGDDYLVASDGDSSSNVTFSTQSIQSGMYDVYGWWTANSSNSYNTKFVINGGGKVIAIEKTERTNGGEWNYIGETELQKSGMISIKVNNNANGNVIADAFRIVYKGPTTGVQEKQVPTDFVLYQNFPNPFNPSTTIRFNLQHQSKVKLRIYNTLGELVQTLIDEELSAGEHQVIFNAEANKSLSSGVYYYNLTTDSFSQTKGMVLIK